MQANTEGATDWKREYYVLSESYIALQQKFDNAILQLETCKARNEKAIIKENKNERNRPVTEASGHDAHSREVWR